jgi:hypothetical protein
MMLLEGRKVWFRMGLEGRHFWFKTSPGLPSRTLGLRGS